MKGKLNVDDVKLSCSQSHMTLPRLFGVEHISNIKQSLRKCLAIKNEGTEIHFLSDALVVVASLDLKVPINGGDAKRF